jgi:hypothetical protein
MILGSKPNRVLAPVTEWEIADCEDDEVHESNAQIAAILWGRGEAEEWRGRDGYVSSLRRSNGSPSILFKLGVFELSFESR